MKGRLACRLPSGLAKGRAKMKAPPLASQVTTGSHIGCDLSNNRLWIFQDPKILIGQPMAPSQRVLTPTYCRWPDALFR